MRLVLKIFIVLILAGCNQNDSTKEQNVPTAKDSTAKTPPAKDSAVVSDQKTTDSIALKQREKKLFDLSERILKAIKERNYSALSKFIHPRSGVRFSLYAHIDTVSNQVISITKLNKLGSGEERIRWGLMDGTGQPVELSIDGYFKRFVYDVDFINAEKKSFNKFLGGGNSLNNLKEIYPGCDFTEFYFSGFDPKYSGMDWKTLRLVFKTYNGKDYLVGVVHDEWTI